MLLPILLSMISWIALGLMTGFFANHLVGQRKQGLRIDLALGLAGAVIGGALFNILSRWDFTRPIFETTGLLAVAPCSLLLAVISAILLIVSYHAMKRIQS